MRKQRYIFFLFHYPKHKNFSLLFWKVYLIVRKYPEKKTRVGADNMSASLKKDALIQLSYIGAL